MKWLTNQRSPRDRKPNLKTGPVCLSLPAVVSSDPWLEPTLSIKLEVSKHRRTVPFKFQGRPVQQLAGLGASTGTLAEQGLIHSEILELVRGRGW